MKTVKINVSSQDKASRVELFVRILWFIISAIILWFFSIIAIICLIVHWFYILVTGKRQKTLNNVLRVYVYYRAKVDAYLMMLTEERNPLLPED
jgi:hypothetical protein